MRDRLTGIKLPQIDLRPPSDRARRIQETRSVVASVRGYKVNSFLCRAFLVLPFFVVFIYFAHGRPLSLSQFAKGTDFSRPGRGPTGGGWRAAKRVVGSGVFVFTHIEQLNYKAG